VTGESDTKNEEKEDERGGGDSAGSSFQGHDGENPSRDKDALCLRELSVGSDRCALLEPITEKRKLGKGDSRGLGISRMKGFRDARPRRKPSMRFSPRGSEDNLNDRDEREKKGSEKGPIGRAKKRG